MLSAHKSFCRICATTTPVSWRSFSAAFIPSASGLIVRSLRFRVAFIWTSVFGMAATGWRSTIRLNIEPQGRGGFQKKKKKRKRREKENNLFCEVWGFWRDSIGGFNSGLSKKLQYFGEKIKSSFTVGIKLPFFILMETSLSVDKIRDCANVQPFFWLFDSFSPLFLPFFTFLTILQRHKFTDAF